MASGFLVGTEDLDDRYMLKGEGGGTTSGTIALPDYSRTLSMPAGNRVIFFGLESSTGQIYSTTTGTWNGTILLTIRAPNNAVTFSENIGTWTAQISSGEIDGLASFMVNPDYKNFYIVGIHPESTITATGIASLDIRNLTIGSFVAI